MKLPVMLVVFLLLYGLVNGVNAKIWIVDNNPNPIGDFTNLTDAHNAAASGDTIYVYPSNNAYAAITVTKQLFLIGSGFDIELHGGLANNAASTISGSMIFNAGSENSSIEGMDGEFAIAANVGNVTMKRNELAYVDINASGGLLLQNEIVTYGRSGTVKIAANLGNILVANNKIYNTQTTATNYHALVCNTTSTVAVANNILKTSHSFASAIINLSATSVAQNNIILYGKLGGAGTFRYNMCNSTQLPAINGNIPNTNMTTVFENPNDFNAGFHLLPGSPALGSGFSGVDMGIYGGDAPYVDGGFPGLPAIFHFESEIITTPQNGLDVVIKAKSNRE